MNSAKIGLGIVNESEMGYADWRAIFRDWRAREDREMGLLIVGHGTRNAKGCDQFLQLVRCVADALNTQQVAGAFLELANPTIEDAIRQLSEKGVKRFLTCPVLLFDAGHSRDDIPAAVIPVAKAFDLECLGSKPPFGLHPLLLRLSAIRFHEARFHGAHVQEAHFNEVQVKETGVNEGGVNEAGVNEAAVNEAGVTVHDPNESMLVGPNESIKESTMMDPQKGFTVLHPTESTDLNREELDGRQSCDGESVSSHTAGSKGSLNGVSIDSHHGESIESPEGLSTGSLTEVGVQYENGGCEKELNATALVMIGRGTSYEPAVACMREYTALHARSMRVGWFGTGFFAKALPSVDAILEQVAHAGYQQVIVQPHLLFEGELSQSLLEKVSSMRARYPAIRWQCAAPLAPHPLLAAALLS